MHAHSVLKYIGLTKNFICFFIHVCGKLNELFGQPSTSWNMNKHKLWRDGVILINRYKKSLTVFQRVHKRTAYVPLAYSSFSWKTASLIHSSINKARVSHLGRRWIVSFLSWLTSVVGLPAPLYHIFILHRGEKKMHFISVSFVTWDSITCNFMIKQLLAHITQLLMTRFVVLCCSVLRLNIPECNILCFNTSYC